MRGISWLAANRLAAQERLRTVEWVSKYPKGSLPLSFPSNILYWIVYKFLPCVLQDLSIYFMSVKKYGKWLVKCDVYHTKFGLNRVGICGALSYEHTKLMGGFWANKANLSAVLHYQYVTKHVDVYRHKQASGDYGNVLIYARELSYF